MNSISVHHLYEDFFVEAYTIFLMEMHWTAFVFGRKVNFWTKQIHLVDLKISSVFVLCVCVHARVHACVGRGWGIMGGSFWFYSSLHSPLCAASTTSGTFWIHITQQQMSHHSRSEQQRLSQPETEVFLVRFSPARLYLRSGSVLPQL